MNDAVPDMVHDVLDLHLAIRDEPKSEPSLLRLLLHLSTAAKVRQDARPTLFYLPQVAQLAINDVHLPRQFRVRAVPQVAPARLPYLVHLHARRSNSHSHRDRDYHDAD
jgi:hypothetical protein